jgi:hypothetical protein
MIEGVSGFLRCVSMRLGQSPLSDRLMLWIDAVGGYWLCLGDQITFGRPDPQGTADVPILGDLGARHAKVCRDGEGYIVEALRDVRVNDRPVGGMDRLGDGSRIVLGQSVRMLFRQPHPLSPTARLEFLSGHRTQPSSDGVLLMADACLLGPDTRSHVVCRRWPHEVVLCRRGAGLFCRAPGRLEIDGLARDGAGPIAAGSRVEGDGVSFNLEAIGA